MSRVSLPRHCTHDIAKKLPDGRMALVMFDDP